MSSHANHLYAFKDFRLDLNETVLLRHGKQVSITPKAFQLLSILVENHGAVVKKEKLISEIWSDSIVEDGNLAFTARLLRQALGDNAREPIYIETVPRKGYRFIAEVSEAPGADDTQTVEHPKSERFEKSRRANLLKIEWGLLVLILVAVGWFFLYRSGVLSGAAPILAESFKAERLSSTGNAAHAVISPNGKLIAYTDQTGEGKWSIWLRQVATAENIQIIPPADVSYGGLAFSRDNNSLFLVRGEKSRKGLDLYRVNVFGGILTKVIEDTQVWFGISPDDRKISYVRCKYAPDDYCSLFVADVDGQNEKRIVTRPQPIRIADNQFSFDGRSIAFAAGQSRTGSNDFGLFQVDLVTGEEREITSERFFNVKYLQWLPSGDELLLTARPCEQQKFSIWKVSVRTGSVTQLTHDDGNFSGLSLDSEGHNLVVTKVDNNFAIYLESLGDRTARRLLAPGASCGFMPDGRIVFESKDLDIWIVDAQGNNKRQLTNEASSDIKPIVARDARSIVFTSNRSGVNHLWRMNIDGSDPKQLTQTEGGYAEFAAPDGSVYYRAGFTGALRKIDFETKTENDLADIDGWAHAFAPGGDVVASFVRDPENGDRVKIVLRRLSDLSIVDVISDVGDEKSDPIHLQWSSDGQSILYLIKPSGEYELWKYALGSKKHVLVAKLGSEPIERVTVSPDGRSIAAVRGNWLHDAFLITGLKY